MEEALWAVQQALLETLFKLPCSQEEAVATALIRIQQTEYWPTLEEHDPPPLRLFYLVFAALVKQGCIEVRRARRGEAIEYGVTYEVAQNLESWGVVEEL